MKDNAPDALCLLDDGGKEFERHILLGLQLLIGPRASGARQIAAVCDFEIKADRIMSGAALSLGRDLLEVLAP
jgi:hypothetical protein